MVQMNLDRGPQFNPAQAATDSRRRMQAPQRELHTWDYARVERFHFATQKADVRILADPAGPLYTNVPVWGAPLGHIWSLKSQSRKALDGYLDPAIGILLFPRLNSQRLLYDFETHLPAGGTAAITHRPFRPLFIPGVPVDSDTLTTPNPALENGWAVEGDKGYVDPETGTGYVIKPDGSIDWRATAIYMLRPGQVRADAPMATRAGDAGDGLGGSVSGGGMLRIGDASA